MGNWQSGLQFDANGNLMVTGAAPGQLPGTTTNDVAAAGNVGELLSAQQISGSAIVLTTATPANIISLALTAGDWDVWGQVDYIPGATTVPTLLQQGLSTVTAALSVQDTFSSMPFPTAVGANLIALPVPMQRIRLAATTTIFLVTSPTFTTSTLSGYGTIFARRRR